MFIAPLSLSIASSPVPESPRDVRQRLSEAVLAGGVDVEPHHALLLAEPGPLPLRVTACVPLRQRDRLLQGELPAQVPERLPVSQGLPGVRRRRAAGSQKAPRLLHEPALEERHHAL